jgi:uncharacterized protein YecE (DUF72 family)
MDVRVGISGWRYGGWRGVFYPEGLPQKQELEYAANYFNSIEINGSFYSLQKPAYFRNWYEQTPRDFIFSVKGARFITHMKKLRDVEAPLANFFASGVLCLEEKLGPILWQFPPQLGFDERWENFFRMLPRDTREAAQLARHHDARMHGRSHVTVRTQRPLRHAIEVRNLSCCSTQFVDLLRQYDVALVVADSAGRFPYFEDVTADFVYVRLHGDVELYTSGYSEAALDRWAERVTSWSHGGEPRDAVRASAKAPAKRAERDVYVYFDNDAKVHAPFDALGLSQRVGLITDEQQPLPARGAPAPPRRRGSARTPARARRSPSGR